MSIIDVARVAQVSKSTVSRVINGHRTVDPAMARRVRAAMDEIGFVPKANRRGPKPKPQKGPEFRTGNIGLVVAGRTREHLELPYIARQLAGITEVVQSSDLNLMIIEMPCLTEVPRVIRTGGVDGVIMGGADASQAIIDMLHPLPCVWLGGRSMNLPLVDHVVPNNPAVGILAADYLSDRGCDRLAYVNNVPMHAAFVVRREAFVETARKHGQGAAVIETPAEGPEIDLWQSEHMRADMNILVRRVLRRKRALNGFFLPTDQQASVFQRALTEHGLKAEQDFVTVSCNRDEPWLAVMNPRPATIDTRPVETGRTAARRLMRRIESPNDEIVTITVRPELVSGSS